MGRATITSIGPARPEDAGAIAPLFQEYLTFYGRRVESDAVTDFLQERLANDEATVFMATLGILIPVPIGFALLYPVFSSLGMRRCWILNDLYVSDPFRRTGIARRLLHAAHHHAAMTGATSIQLETERTNTGARDLYESEGYRQDERFVRYALAIPPDMAGGFTKAPGHHGAD